MILRTLKVEGWQCFANPLNLGPLSERINVVHGPNGTGKSTLLWAMIRGLMDNHALGGRSGETLRPWNRALTPRIALELDHNGNRLRLTKQFLDSPQSELSRWEDDRWVRLAEGRAADAQVRAMLDGSLPGHGLTDQRHWGLAQVFWAPQGQLALPELATGVAGAIRASLGAQMTNPVAEAIESRISEAYGDVYTDKGKLKGGTKNPAAIVRLEKQRDEARQRRDELQEQCDQFELLSRQVDEVGRRRDELTESERQLADELERLDQQVETFNGLRSQLRQQTSAAEAAKACYDQLKTLLDTRDAARKDLNEANELIAGLERELPKQSKEVERCTKEETEAAGSLAALVARGEQIEQTRRRAEMAERYRGYRARLDDLDKRLSQATELKTRRERLAEERARQTAPDTARLRAIQAAFKRRDALEATLRAAMIRVDVEPEADFTIEVERAEQPGQNELGEGRPLTITGSPSVEFHIPGVARFRATGPTGSVEAIRAELADVEHQLKPLLAGLGTRDPAELETLHDEAVALDRQIAETEAKLLGLLGAGSLDSLQQERHETATAVQRIETDVPEWIGTLPDPETLRAEAQRVEQEFAVERTSA
ncbi:MAG: hypothetical protein JW888_03300, partial [Pirellulales bacterium]|nr:hypothetical protein [Pirellulales bacterium]